MGLAPGLTSAPLSLLPLSAAPWGHEVALLGTATGGGRVVTQRGYDAAPGRARIRSVPPAVIEAPLQILQVLPPVQPPLQLGDHAAQFPNLELGDVHLLLALAATVALLPISILLIWASRSNFQIFLLRYMIHHQMFSPMSTPGSLFGGRDSA